jgi:nitroreductase
MKHGWVSLDVICSIIIPKMKKAFFEVIDKRVSCREFIPDYVLSENEIQSILHAASRAPTAGNLQAWKVCLLKDEKLKELSVVYGREWIADASIAFIFFADLEASAVKYKKRGRKLYALQDATIACSYAQLSCEFLGLGACWVGAFSEENICQLCGIETTSEFVPTSLLIIGKPTPTARKHPRSRKPVQEMLILPDSRIEENA